MLTLPFASMDSPISDEMKEVTRAGALELNNALVVPMKILNIVFVEDKKAKRVDIKLEVEDCLDLKEWQQLRQIFVIGANCQQKISKAEATEKLKEKLKSK